MSFFTNMHLVSFLILLSLMLNHYGYGQSVGLVLSGGGAKGVCHIGVLKALEENQIPIDYIAGTSMGAIIGALYASGYTPGQIEELMTSETVKQWASGTISEEYKFFIKQNDPNASWINVPFALNESFSSILPTNIVAPYSMDYAFMEFFSGPSAVASYDFDSLMIPFRCVASDIDSNRAVVIASGNLSNAVRASVTYPFYFRPIMVNNKLLFDGGMYNNFPADVIRQDFDPDVIIGSKAAGNYDTPSSDNIISQIQNMLMMKTDYSIGEENGLVIEHNIGHVNVIDFSRARAFIDSGYAEANRRIDEIREIIRVRRKQSVVREMRDDFRKRQPELIIDTVYALGVNRAKSLYIARQLMRGEHYVSLQELKKGYFRLIADNKFDFIYPELVYNKASGYYDLYLRVDRTEQFIAEFGGNLSSSAVNEAFVGLQFNLLGTAATTLYSNAYFGRFYSSFKLDGKFDFPSRTPYFVQVGYIYNHRDYFKNTTYFFEDKDPSFLVENENLSYLQLGLSFGNTGKILAGANFGQVKDDYYQTNTFTRLDTADVTSFELISPFFKFELNSLNRKQYASAGARLLINLRYINGTEKNIPGSTMEHKEEFSRNHDYLSLNLIYDNYFDSFRRIKFGFYSELYLSNQEFFNNYTSSILSATAFEPIPESKTLFLPNYRAFNYGALGLKTVVPIMRNLDFRMEAYLMQPYRQISQDFLSRKAFSGKEFENRSFIGSSSLVFFSPIGPLSLSVNYYDRTRDSFSVFLNFGYIIFNRSIFD
ncbi:MAG: patatin-like phospholipase family protein [Bacteroidota bacterium]|nr:patatin-like phospholipase family protein [Bacteroidota bacterium]